MLILPQLFLRFLLDHLEHPLPFPLHLLHPPLAVRSDVIDFLKPLPAVLLVIDSFLAIFLLPLPDFFLRIDLKQRLFRGFILGKLPKLEIEIRLQHPQLFFQPGALVTVHCYSLITIN